MTTFESRQQLSLLTLAFAVVFVTPLIVFAVSFVSTPIFLARYFEPSVACWAIVLSGLYNQMQCSASRPQSDLGDSEGPGGSRGSGGIAAVDSVQKSPTWEKNVSPPTYMQNPGKEATVPLSFVRKAVILMVVIAHVSFLASAFALQRGRAPGQWTGGIVPDDLPLVCESPAFFLTALRYAARPNYVFVLDRTAAVDPAATGVVIEQYKSFVQLKEYFPRVPVIAAEELTRISKFAVLEDPLTRWSEGWVQRHPEYVRKLITGKPAVILLVERRQSR